jgi:hypothetical protein
METKEKQLDKTVKMDDIFKQVHNDPINCFEKWPIKEIRQKCLERIKERGFLLSIEERAKWAENNITSLLDQENDEDKKLAMELLSLYIFDAPKKGAIQAIEFAISLRKRGEFLCRVSLLDLSKIIAGRILKGDIICQEIPSLKKFLQELINELKTARDSYVPGEWYCAERAIRIIMLTEDFSFLPQIEELIILFQQPNFKPIIRDLPYQKEQDLAVLKVAKRILIKAQKEHLLTKNK